MVRRGLETCRYGVRWIEADERRTNQESKNQKSRNKNAFKKKHVLFSIKTKTHLYNNWSKNKQEKELNKALELKTRLSDHCHIFGL